MKKIKEGLKSLRRWLPVIWRDRGYDHSFIYEILKHKLLFQADSMQNAGFIEDSDYYAARMRLCVRLIDKIQNDEYSNEFMNFYDSKLEWLSYGTNNTLGELSVKEISENFQELFNKYPKVYAQVKEQVKDNKYQQAIAICHINHERAKILLFKIFQRDLEKWWW